MTATFSARHGGSCAECGHDVTKGSPATYRGGEFVHEECPTDAVQMPHRDFGSPDKRDPAELGPQGPICPSCFTAKASNGACLCEGGLMPVIKVPVTLRVSLERFRQALIDAEFETHRLVRRMNRFARRFERSLRAERKRRRHAAHCPRPLPIDGHAYHNRRRRRR